MKKLLFAIIALCLMGCANLSSINTNNIESITFTNAKGTITLTEEDKAQATELLKDLKLLKSDFGCTNCNCHDYKITYKDGTVALVSVCGDCIVYKNKIYRCDRNKIREFGNELSKKV